MSLFSDEPCRTDMASHDVDSEDAKPIKPYPDRVNLQTSKLMKD